MPNSTSWESYPELAVSREGAGRLGRSQTISDEQRRSH